MSFFTEKRKKEKEKKMKAMKNGLLLILWIQINILSIKNPPREKNMSKSHLMMKNVKYCGVRFLRQRNSSFVEGKIIWVIVSYVRKLPSLISNSIRADLYGPKSPFQK